MDLYKSSLCWYDYIEVRDGYWRKAPLLGEKELVIRLPFIQPIHGVCGDHIWTNTELNQPS